MSRLLKSCGEGWERGFPGELGLFFNLTGEEWEFLGNHMME